MYILVSACLLGDKVRYDGTDKALSNDLLNKWREQHHIVPLCPEVSGGLPVPRLPAEIQPDSRILNKQRQDVTQYFKKGADLALQQCQKHQIKVALLKANSPSCGNEQIYNGQFSGELIVGMGITARRLIENGVTVFNEHQLEEMDAFLKQQAS